MKSPTKRRLLAVLAGATLCIAGTVASATAVAGSANTDTLSPGQKLVGGQHLISNNGTYVLDMQTDGNLVEYEGSTVLFATDTYNQAGNWVIMQTDGNLVVYGSANQVRWNSHTFDHSGSDLVLQDDANLVIYDSGAAIWARSWLQTAAGAQAFAKALFVQYGWSVSSQYPYLNDVWGNIESGWRWDVCNGGALYPNCDYTGAAYGIPQADPGDKMASYNPDWATDGLTQVAWGLNYIHQVYGTPYGAWYQEEYGCSSPPCGYVVGHPPARGER